MIIGPLTGCSLHELPLGQSNIAVCCFTIWGGGGFLHIMSVYLCQTWILVVKFPSLISFALLHLLEEVNMSSILKQLLYFVP